MHRSSIASKAEEEDVGFGVQDFFMHGVSGSIKAALTLKGGVPAKAHRHVPHVKLRGGNRGDAMCKLPEQ
jgi:hypothetical protein